MNEKIPEKDEIFRRLLIAGDLFAPLASDEQGRPIRNLLKQYGITLNQSDFQVLDRCTIGNSQIMIVRYMLDYMICEEAAEKRIQVEGTVASEMDSQGNTHIRILSHPRSPYPTFGIAQGELPPVKSNP